MDFTGWTNILILDRDLPIEKQAEGTAVHNAVIYGHCDKCAFLGRCSTDVHFQPPVFAWCFQEKKRILADWYTHSVTADP